MFFLAHQGAALGVVHVRRVYIRGEMVQLVVQIDVWRQLYMMSMTECHEPKNPTRVSISAQRKGIHVDMLNFAAL